MVEQCKVGKLPWFCQLIVPSNVGLIAENCITKSQSPLGRGAVVTNDWCTTDKQIINSPEPKAHR